MYYTKAQISEKKEDSFTAVASTDTEDRQGERVLVEGWQLKNFKENPILLFMHDHTKPIGKATRVWIEKTTGRPRLMFKGMVSTATEVGRAAKQLMDEGILNSFSVGFRPLEMDGNIISKSELYEISLVSVPANPEARLVAVKSLEDAGFEDEVISSFVGEDKDALIVELKTELADTRKVAEQALEQAAAAVKGLQHLAPQNRSMQAVTTKRLELSKVIARAADILILNGNPKSKVVANAKVIKRSSELLIRSHKQDL